MANENKKPEVKKPKFNAYWIYAAIILGIIGIQIFGGTSLTQPSQTNESDFQEFLINGDVDKIEIVNRKLAKIYLTQEAKTKEVHLKKKGNSSFLSSANDASYQFEFGDLLK
jgi:hypothetical protein